MSERDHPISVAVDAAISRAESPDLNPTMLDREMALDRIEDALTRAIAVTHHAASLRLEEAKLEKQRSCQGCGWKIVTLPGTRETTQGEPRRWFCVACDPKGNREVVRAEAELFEKHGI